MIYEKVRFQSPLHKACSLKKEKCARILIQHMQDVASEEDVKEFLNMKTKNDEGNTPLHIATAENDISMMKMLIEYGADLKELNNRGQTMLHAAVQNDNVYGISFFLDEGINVDAKDLMGKTPLHWACY